MPTDKWLVSEIKWKREPQPPNVILIVLDRAITVWEAGTGKKLKTMEGMPSEPVFPLVVVGQYSLFLSPSLFLYPEEKLTQWDLKSGKVISTWKTPEGLVSNDGRFLLRRVGPPGRVDLWRIGEPQNSVHTFQYRSPLCNYRANQNSEGSQPEKLKFELKLMFDGYTEEHIHFGGRSYTVSDCTELITRHIPYASPELANERLHREISRATRVLENGPRKDHWAEALLGDRAVLLFKDEFAGTEIAEIVWTEGREYIEIESWSLPTLLESERQMMEK